MDPVHASPLDSLQNDFASDRIEGWSYPARQAQAVPYGKGVVYFHDCGSVEVLATRNHAEARAVNLSDTGLSVTADGIFVGVVYRPVGSPESEPTRPKFEKPVPLDDATSGDQPPITGFYPRVVFPATGEFQYSIMLNASDAYRDGRFGIKHEVINLDILPHTSPSSVAVPMDCACLDGVREALRAFINEIPGKYSLDQGAYKVKLELEFSPVVTIRIDGARPLHSRLVGNADAPLELPITGASFDAVSMIGGGPMAAGKLAAPNDPTRRAFIRGVKYNEIPVLLNGLDNPTSWAHFGRCQLEYKQPGGESKQDSADLVYVALRRHESVAEARGNPNLGLVEVQVDRMVRVLSAEVEFTPKVVPPPPTRDSETDFLRDLSFGFGGLMRGSGGGGSFGAPSVSTGRTELANPRTGKVSPKVGAEWCGHVKTFRFCLTNAVT